MVSALMSVDRKFRQRLEVEFETRVVGREHQAAGRAQ
jgi:hypothetical protein